MNTMIQLNIARQSWPILGEFRIARGSKTIAEVIVVSLNQDGCTGRGECVPYPRYGESLQTVAAQIESLRSALTHAMSRQELQSLLPAGAARNALDCAFWDLHSQQSGKSVWQLANLPAPKPLTTAFTLSIDTPQKMAKAALQAKNRPLLKLKLAGEKTDILRVQAIAQARPKAQLILDGNEGYTLDGLKKLLSQIADLNIAAIEQPLPVAQDQMLQSLQSPFAICADESLHTLDDLARIAQLYDMINIKLDKTGGLTEAIALQQQATKLGLQIMVGCMVATSLSMAPALLIASHAKLVDLDGPLLLSQDRIDGLCYQGAKIPVQDAPLWGVPRRD